MMGLEYGAVSDRGDRRSENQDSMICFAGEMEGHMTGLFAVADGMGGLEYGGQVSRYITRQFDRWRREDFRQMLRAGRDGPEDIQELLEQEIWEINQSVLRFKNEAQCRAGSTLSLLFLYRGRYYVKNLGDSRIYLMRGGVLRRLTEDQSVAAQMVRERRMTEEEARNSRQKSVLTMCVGMCQVPLSFTADGQVCPDDQFLLCSDGLYNPLADAQMEQVLCRPCTGQEKADSLRRMIPLLQADDNVSCIVVRVTDMADESASCAV